MRACSLGSGGGESAGHLERVVDVPLETSEGSNHEDSGSETVPESLESNLSVDLSDLSAGGHTVAVSSLVEDRDHSVSWVRNNSTENTGPVSREESNEELSALAVGLLWSSPDVLVHSLDGVLESSELNHSVWHLSEPQWGETLVESVPSLGVHDLWPSLTSGGWEGAWVRGLHTDLQLFTKERQN